MFKMIIGVLVVTVVLLITMAVVDRVSGEIVNPTSASLSTSVGDSLQVTITGEVTHTGTYFLPLKSTLSDLLASAGGATSNADPKAYDTSLLLANKSYFYIAPLYDNANACSLTPISKVNINTAEEAALKKGVDAFTSVVCSAIVGYRGSNGNFKQLEDLKSVTGIRDTTDCVRIFGVVKVSVRLHAPHSKKGSMGPCPELIMVSAPEWVGGE